MKASPPADITLPQFTAVFVAFGVLAVLALLWPELTQALDLNRTKATIWATTLLLIPALVLYPFHTLSARIANLAHLFWTFAYLMFLLHAYWAVFVIFDGVADTFRQMGPLIASVNFLLLAWWVRALGIVFAALVVVALAVRLWARDRSDYVAAT